MPFCSDIVEKFWGHIQNPHSQAVLLDINLSSPCLYWANKSLFKGTVARDFLPPVFPRMDPILSTNLHPRIFLNSVSNLQKYSYLNVVLRGLIPRRTLFRGVWYPEGLCSAGSDTPQNFVKQGIRPCRILFCGVSDLAEQVSAIKCTPLCHCSAGSDTPQD